MGNCWSRFRIMGGCWPRLGSSEPTSPRHSRSTPSSTPTLEPSEPYSQDSVGFSPSMEPSQSSIVDCVRCSPLMEPSQRYSVDSLRHSPLINDIESIREMYETIDTVEQIDRLASFVENYLQKMNTPSEAGSSSLEGWLEIVGDGTKLGAKTIDIIFTQVEKISDSDAVKAIEIITMMVMKAVGEMHWVFVGLSVAAYAVENNFYLGSTERECREILLNILELAKEVNQNSKRMSDEKEKLYNAVCTIVKGSVIFCYFLKRENIFSFWSATTAAAQFKKTNQQLRDVKDSLALSSLQQLLDYQWRKDYGGDKEVFLSHSGAQKNFVRQLHRDLTSQHVSCFFDEDHNSLPLAQRFPPLIFKAAETCKIAVLVLSKEFVRSKWPMLELSAFISAMNSENNPNLKLLPIFFMITPKELSQITKDCPEWENLGVSNDTKDKWHVALKVVRSINGLPFREGGDEVQLRDKVVKEICCLLHRINPPQLLDFEPVGIGEQVREVKALLKIEDTQSALAVIVYGFGGIGKSTVAAYVVQSLDWSSTNFKFCKVAIDEKTLNKTSHIIELQKHIIYKLDGVKLDFQDPVEGRILIKKALAKKYSLLFIDNVVDKDYIRDLLPRDLESAQQETKLRIIITSREKNVKVELNIICNEYEVKGLSHVDSERLLVDTIVQSHVVEENEKRMINEVALACRGVPLLLSVFGKHLRVERNKDSYQEALDVLRKGNLDSYRDEDLSTTLMFVYDKIKDTEVKEAFLDICTFFHGWEWNVVADILDFFKLEDLRRKALVSKNGSNEVIVHDILRLMGIRKARLTRFSDYKELSNVLEDNLELSDNKDSLDGFVKVKGISLVNDNCPVTIQCTQLEAMSKSLRVLMLGDWIKLDGPPCQKAFRNLRYLRVGDITAFPFKDPSKLDKLRIFLNRSKLGMSLSHLPSSVVRISHEVPHVECGRFAKLPLQNLSFLKSFIVKTSKSVELPEDLQLPASLVDLNLNKCKNLPKDIGHLTALQSLILDRSNIKCLPQGFGKLQNMKYLSMDYCLKLTFLCEELGMLSSLEALSIEGCVNLRTLPERLEGLHALQTLELSGSISLHLLPESFGKLRLRSLKLDSLVKLNELPNSFGNMPLLENLSFISCDSLMSLPNTFVQLKMLETLNLKMCNKLSVLPEDFGQLRCLKDMKVKSCKLFKELPRGFGALPALKAFKLSRCNSFVNLPRDFIQLTSLEELRLEYLPLISNIPDGFGKLKNLKNLNLKRCVQLKTVSDDFENMPNLELLTMRDCPELEGAIMEKIVKLQHCYMADIRGSSELEKKWKHMQSEIEHPVAVDVGGLLEAQERAIRVALLQGKCMEVNNTTGQLVERSSLFSVLEKGRSVTVALIMLPFHMQSHQHQNLQRFIDMARETNTTNGSEKLQIVCAGISTPERATPTEEEERAEEEGIRQILLSLPTGSCAIPSSESKRRKLLSWCFGLGNHYHEKLFLFMANKGLNIDDLKTLENIKFTKQDETSANVVMEHPPSKVRKPENKPCNSIQNFVESICPKSWDWDWDCDWDKDLSETDVHSQSQSVVGQNKTREFIEALKGNGIDYLLTDNNTSKVMVDDLHGKTIGFITCDFKFLEHIKLQQIYKDLQQKVSNFIAIWIPIAWPGDCGHGTYTRLIQCMPWASIPHPRLIHVENSYSSFVIVDKNGQIACADALPLILAWGVKAYPFTQHSIAESFSQIEFESCLEFLLHGMNIVGRKPMRKKMTFLYAERPSNWHKLKYKLAQLTQINGNFEVISVGQLYDWGFDDIEKFRQDYEDRLGEYDYGRWASLSLSDMIMFWCRCEYLEREECYELYKQSNMMMEPLHRLAKSLCSFGISLVVVDNNGPVTCGGVEVLQMICGSLDEISNGQEMKMVKDELMKSLSRGECSPIVKSLFRDEIHDLPQHPQHPIPVHTTTKYRTCDVCLNKLEYDGGRSYRCEECKWDMCGSCWMVYAKQQAQHLMLAKDN